MANKNGWVYLPDNIANSKMSYKKQVLLEKLMYFNAQSTDGVFGVNQQYLANCMGCEQPMISEMLREFRLLGILTMVEYAKIGQCTKYKLNMDVINTYPNNDSTSKDVNTDYVTREEFDKLLVKIEELNSLKHKPLFFNLKNLINKINKKN